MDSISLRAARRLALTRAGLLKPQWTDMPRRAKGQTRRARLAALQIIRRFGYLQLDTVSIAGARSHALVLLSRLEGFDAKLAEQLLQPGEPLFEYWGHEACWLPVELYPVFQFRREEYSQHPWWGDVVAKNPEVAANLRRRITEEGPLRSLDMEGRGSRGWWDLKVAKRVASALWSSGELAIRERSSFQRTYDLRERVIPRHWLEVTVPRDEAFDRLLLLALSGHGWATTGTLARTWRLTNRADEIRASLGRLVEKQEVVACKLHGCDGPTTVGWARPEDLELAARLERVRPRADRGVLLSPFDPVLWDRERVQRLFGFHQVLEIFKPASKRIYGYYCLPVLAGEHLVARFDLKADHKAGRLKVLTLRFEGTETDTAPSSQVRQAAETAIQRHAQALQLSVVM